eukprot:02511_5
MERIRIMFGDPSLGDADSNQRIQWVMAFDILILFMESSETTRFVSRAIKFDKGRSPYSKGFPSTLMQFSRILVNVAGELV